MVNHLPTIYYKALVNWPDWGIKIPTLGDREWQLASAGPNNPLQLDTELNIDGTTISFIEQMLVWVDISKCSKNANTKPLDGRFAKCLAIGEDNSELLLIGPDGDSLYVFHHDGMSVEKVFDSISALVAIMSGSSQTAHHSADAERLPKPFIGRWKNADESSGDEFLSLAPNGSAVRQFDDGSSHVGTWTVKNDSLCLNVGEPGCPLDLESYQVESISTSQMALFDRENDFHESFEKCD